MSALKKTVYRDAAEEPEQGRMDLLVMPNSAAYFGTAAL